MTIFTEGKEVSEPKVGEYLIEAEHRHCNSICVQVTEVNGKNFKGKLLDIYDPHFEQYVTIGKTYSFNRWKDGDNIWHVPDKELNRGCGPSQLLLYSWPEGYSFDLDC